MEIFLEKKYEVPKSAQEETEKLTRSIATKESENPRETTDCQNEWESSVLLPDKQSLHKKQPCFYVPAKTNWENVAKNTLAFVTAIKNRKHLGISLAETAQDFYGENVQSSSHQRKGEKLGSCAPITCHTASRHQGQCSSSSSEN